MIDLLRQHQDAIAELCRRYRLARMDVFGSAAEGEFDEARSDLDLLVDFRDGYPDGPFGQYFDFLAALKSLLGRVVDLVETRAIKNPYFAPAGGRAPAPGSLLTDGLQPA